MLLPGLRLTLILALTPAVLSAGDWQPIFDGKTLQGWKSSPDNPAAFSVEPDGVLKVAGARAHLYYVGDKAEQSFANFELKLKVKTTPSSNSGVFFHTRFQPSGWPAHGYEAQVNSTHRDGRKSGSIYNVMDCWADPEAFADGAQSPFMTFAPDRGTRLHLPEAPTRDGEWFDYYIKVAGKTITVAINGRITVEYTEPDTLPADTTRRLGSGTIALQAHDPGSTVYYRDIQLKLLD